jgi:hypothetical protein
MSESFNGYHVWLGIPPSEQPPNHYRLLGIAIFETDLDVIDHAADRQMAHVRTFQSGRNAGLSQRILNELSAARMCLLNVQRKADYDGELRAKLAAAPQVAAVPVAAMPVGKAVPMAQPAIPTAIPMAAAPPSRPTITPKATPKALPGAPKAVPSRIAAAAIPLDTLADELDPYELDTQDLARAAEPFDDYEQELISPSAGTPRINPLAVRRSTKGDAAFQRAITYILIGLAVVIVLMTGFEIVKRYAGTVGDLFKQAPATESAADTAPGAAAGPKAPAPAPPGSAAAPDSSAVSQ